MKKQVKLKKIILLDAMQLDQTIGVAILMYIKICILVKLAFI